MVLFLGPTTKLMLRLPQGNKKQIRMHIQASLKVIVNSHYLKSVCEGYF